MKTYFQQIFRHEFWANQQVFETLLTAENPPERASQIASHLIAAQRIWLDRLIYKNSDVKVWEDFEPKTFLELLETNHQDLMKFIENCEDIEQLIAYENSKGEKFANTIKDILTHLSQHAAYHRGQIIVLIKPFVEKLPATDFIVYARRN